MSDPSKGPRLARSLIPLLLSLSPALLPAAQLPVADAPPDTQQLLQELMGPGLDFDPTVPTPEEVVGHRPGEWHLSHDRLVSYFRALDAASERFHLEEIGRSHEGRPILTAVVASPGRLSSLDEVRTDHLQALAEDRPAGEDPVVVWMGYSIHGNEASGSNAAPVVAYLLAAGRGPVVDEVLEQAVVLLDPSLNPDGMNRFASWVNSHRGMVPVADRASREHDEAWPGARTNHYWFDLNRDWLPVVHPESRARVGFFHAWKPNVVTDHHEMGTDSTYFFQPGVPSRKNPLTPDENVRLTEALAEHHARRLDDDLQLYFSEEVFDDFYYGKGSTYPDINGSIGILFEQASARGHLADSIHGELSFADAIRNQVTTSLSTLQGSVAERERLLAYQRGFYSGAAEEARAAGIGGWIFGAGADGERARALARLLRTHDIELRGLSETVEVEGVAYRPGAAFYVPAEQPQFRMARALFETRTEFPDPVFYDVSTWTLPLAFDLDHAVLDRGDARRLPADVRVDQVARPEGLPVADSGVAWAFHWTDSRAPEALTRLLADGFRVKAASRPFTAVTPDGDERFEAGSIVIARGIQALSPEAVREGLERAAATGVRIHAIRSGLTPEGVDLGSRSLPVLEPVRPAVVVGDGVSSYQAGEVWHLLDHELGMRTSLIEREDLEQLDLDDYSHLLLVSGRYGSLSEGFLGRLRDWLDDGGVLVAQKSALRWVSEVDLAPLKIRDREASTTDGEEATEDAGAERRPYSEHDRDRAEDLVSGTIFMGDVDRSHPLGWGLPDRRLPLFRTDTRVLERLDDPYANAVVYTDAPRISGYASQENIDRIAGSAAAVAVKHGEGTVVALADDTNFRGFWHGSRRLYLNALFFGAQVEPTGP